MLGVSSNGGNTVEGIVDSMADVVQVFCTARHGAPEGVVAAPSIEWEVAERIVAKVKIFDADAASNEKLAGIKAVDIFPNLDERVNDKTHASRRNTSQPWKSDPRIKDVFEFLVDRSDSVVRLIENPGDIKRIFHGHIQKQMDWVADGEKV